MKDLETGIIICGFAGIGKSYLAKNYENTVDLESTPFQKDWKTYVRVADHMRKNGYIVLMSCHNELREELHNQDIPYYVILPDPECKDIYLERYKKRGNDQAFIDLMDKNFENFCIPKEWEHDYYVKLRGDMHLSTLLHSLITEYIVSQGVNF